jgi:hypothetical protein
MLSLLPSQLKNHRQQRQLQAHLPNKLMQPMSKHMQLQRRMILHQQQQAAYSYRNL